jgi:hypothetical protein
MALTIQAQTYNWPCVPLDQQRNINGTFCENRKGAAGDIDHFHNGVDIDLPENNYVYSVISGTITSLATREQNGINAYVRVGRYAYVHVDPAPGITVGTPVTAYETIIGTTNSWNHIHFKDGFLGSEINPLRDGGGLTPFSDPYNPGIEYIHFYLNGTSNRFQDNRVYGKVDIVSWARDRTGTGAITENNGVYSIGYQIFDSLGTTPLMDPVVNFIFDNIPSDDYITNVYFPGSNNSTHIYKVTNRITSDRYWDTDELGLGVYQVLVFAEDTRFNRIERWEIVEIVPYDNKPPAIPELVSLIGNESNHWELKWLQNDSSDQAGYTLMYSYDTDNWSIESEISSSLMETDTHYVYEGFPNQTTIYFRLNAYDDAPFINYSEPSDAYGVRLSDTGEDVLIVDGFDRTNGYWLDPSHTFVYQYATILTEFNLAFNTCSEDAIVANGISLGDYATVIYLLGDESGENKALSPEEQEALKSYLQHGGNLIISGSEIGNDLVAKGSEEDQAFFQNYLKSEFFADSAESLLLAGEEGTIFENYSGEIRPPLGTLYKSDIISPAGSEKILNFTSSAGAGIYFSGMFEGGSSPGQVVHFSFPIELLNDEERKDLLERVLNLFDIISSGKGITYSGIPAKFELSQNYPNPFNPTTIINYELQITNDVELTIYNVLGEKVKTLVSENQAVGSHSIEWDASDLASGIYYYELRTSDFRDVKKMVLMK